MGNRQAFIKSKSGDVPNNLLWAIEQDYKWDSKFSADKRLLHLWSSSPPALEDESLREDKIAELETKYEEPITTAQTPNPDDDGQLQPPTTSQVQDEQVDKAQVLHKLEAMSHAALQECSSMAEGQELSKIMAGLEEKAAYISELVKRLVEVAINNHKLSIAWQDSKKKQGPAFYPKKLKQRLKRGLSYWDNARFFICFLLEEYGTWFSFCENYFEVDKMVKYFGMLEEETKVDLCEKRVAHRSHDLDSLREKLAELQQARGELKERMKRLTLGRLAVGFRYRDKNFSGHLEAEDVPEMSGVLFSKLDLDGRHSISPKEFVTALERLQMTQDGKEHDISECQEERQMFEKQKEEVCKAASPLPLSSAARKQIELLEAEIQEKREREEELLQDLENVRVLEKEVSEYFSKATEGEVADMLPEVPLVIKVDH